MISTKADDLTSLETELQAVYGRMADLLDRWDLNETQKLKARAGLVHDAVMLGKRRRELVADRRQGH